MKKYLGLLRSMFKGEFILDQKMLGLSSERRFKVQQLTNYIRISTLELAVREIYEKQVAGAVAELGVYKGEFAKYLNAAFPDRRLYLFDSFEGFSDRDSTIDRNQNFSTGDQNFSDTSVSLVLGKMKHRDNCIVKKGWFPESLQGLEETFCFVSLDADLYKPIYDGLEYFYPRLSKGGYIFVHDYNNNLYAGAKQAVREFCEKMNIGYTPISDSWGTVVIAK